MAPCMYPGKYRGMAVNKFNLDGILAAINALDASIVPDLCNGHSVCTEECRKRYAPKNANSELQHTNWAQKTCTTR